MVIIAAASAIDFARGGGARALHLAEKARCNAAARAWIRSVTSSTIGSGVVPRLWRDVGSKPSQPPASLLASIISSLATCGSGPSAMALKAIARAAVSHRSSKRRRSAGLMR